MAKLNSITLNFIGQSPRSVLEYVEFLAEGYVQGSQGQVKYVRDYDSNDNLVKVTQFKYENSDYPTRVTEILELDGDE